MNKSEMGKLMTVIAVEFGGKFPITEERVQLWLNILGHASGPEVSRAIAQVIGESRDFPPSVGAVNCKVLENRSGAVEVDWSTEWTLVLRAASNSSYNAEQEAAKLKPLTLRAAGGIPGLRELALASSDSLPTIRAQFRQRFEDLSSKAVQREFKNYVEGTAKAIIGMDDKKQLGGK